MVDFATLKLVGDTTGLKPVAPALDAIVAKSGQAESAIKKLGTSTTGMGAKARQAATDTRAVSTALDKIEADANQAAVALRNAEGALKQVGMQSNVAGGAVGNLGAQVFDIGVMMQAGQNPFTLMVQQGSQVAQVLGPMGAGGAVAALKATFIQLLSPINLATFAIIGGVAALVNWATSAGDAEAETDALTAAMERQKAVVEGLKSVLEELTLTRQMMASGAETQAEQAALNEMVRLSAERNVLEMERTALLNAANEAYGLINESALAEVEAKIAANAEAQRSNEQLRANIGLEREATAEAELYKSVKEALAGIDISGPWQAVLGAIDNAIARADQYRATVAAAQNALAAMKMEFSPGGRALGAYGSRTPGGTSEQNALATRSAPVAIPSSGSGRSGGGGRSAAASEAEKQAQAIEKVVAGLRKEIEAVGATAEARRLQQELQKAGVEIYSQEGQQIAALVEQLTELEAKQKLVAETLQGIEGAAEGFFVGVLSGAKDLKSAIGDVLKSLGDLLLNQAFKMLWGGAAAGGMGGGLGGLFAGLFDAGGRIPAGAIGVVAEKRPEFVDGKLVTSPTLMEGPASVTGGAATANLLNTAPGMQVAMRRPSQQMQAPAPRVTVQPPPVIVLDDPRKIDAWSRSPEGERASAWQNRRRGNG